MQFNQPQGFMCPVQQNQPYQHFMHDTPVSPQNFGNFFNVTNQPIGEGEVVPIQCPDGSMQFYFVPRSLYNQKQCFCSIPCMCNNGVCQCNPANTWLIKSIASTVTPQLPPAPSPFYNRQQTQPYQEPLQWHHKLMFHNDAATSATDLHYFCPRLKSVAWQHNTATSVQTNQPAVKEMQTSTCDMRSTGSSTKMKSKTKCTFADEQNIDNECNFKMNEKSTSTYRGEASMSSCTCHHD